MKTIEQIYQERCALKTDINEHLPVLRELATGLDQVVEFGVRDGNSTAAFLAAGANLYSVDLNDDPALAEIREACPDWTLVLGDTAKVEIPDCDLLFIDSNHTSKHLEKELAKHARRVRQFIALHDTVTFWDCDQFRNEEGMGRAIMEFLYDHPEWEVFKEYKNSNGLTIWKKKEELNDR